MNRGLQLGGALALGAAAGWLAMADVRLVAVGAALGLALLLRGAWALKSQRIARVAWAGAAFSAPLNGVRVSSVVALSDVFLLAAVATMLPSLALGSRRPVPSRSHAGVLCGLAAIAVGGTVGTIFATQPSDSLIAIAKFVLGALGSVTALALWAPGRGDIRAFCALWLAGATASSAWALTISETTVGRPAGLATHPNHLGIVCVLGIGIALGFALDDRRRGRLLGLLSCPVLVVALLASGSRAAVLGLFVVVPAVAIFSHRVQVALAAVGVGAMCAVAVLAGLLHLPPETGVGRLLGDRTAESDLGRIEFLERSVARYERHPLTGEGFEVAQEAHNVYLQVLVGAGPLGLVGLTVVAASTITAVRRGVGRRTRRTKGDTALLAGLGGGYAGYLVAGAFQNILWDRYLWLYVAATLSLALNLELSRRTTVTRPGGTGRPSRPPDRPAGASPRAGRVATPSTRGDRWSR